MIGTWRDYVQGIEQQGSAITTDKNGSGTDSDVWNMETQSLLSESTKMDINGTPCGSRLLSVRFDMQCFC